jgi:hypothetical protein
MFTPPPSPAPPPRTLRNESPIPSDSDDSEGSQYLLVPDLHHVYHSLAERPKPTLADQHASSEAAKHRTGRRTKWTILFVPLVLVFITASTRYVSHPAILDIFSAGSDTGDWQSLPSSLTEWRMHKRHASPDPAPQADSSQVVAFPTPTSSQSSSSSQAATPTSGDGADQGIPTIPSVPPVLPTPFPQPLDDTFSRNFSTQGCLDFFANMTSSDSFRTCRPFSLLQVQSDAFIQVCLRSFILELSVSHDFLTYLTSIL